MENFEKLQLACQKYGKREVAKRLQVAESSIYRALSDKRGLRPLQMLELERLLAEANAGVPPQEEQQQQAPSVTPPPALSQLERLILEKVKRLTEQEQAQVLAYVVQLESLHDK